MPENWFEMRGPQQAYIDGVVATAPPYGGTLRVVGVALFKKDIDPILIARGLPIVAPEPRPARPPPKGAQTSFDELSQEYWGRVPTTIAPPTAKNRSEILQQYVCGILTSKEVGGISGKNVL